MIQRTSLFVFLALLSLLAAFGCKRDKCKKVDCGAGSCVEGNCVCPTGYEGAGCATLIAEKFVGTFDNVEACRAGSDAYTVRILLGASTDGLKLIGLWESSDTLEAALVPEGDQFTIPRQAMGNHDIEGSGHLDEVSGDILIDYSVYSQGSAFAFDWCDAVLSQQ